MSRDSLRESIFSAVTKAPGITRGELDNLPEIETANPYTVGQLLAWAMRRGEIRKDERGRFYLDSDAPNDGHIPSIPTMQPTNGNGHARVELSEHQKSRTAQTVGIYSTPTEFDEVVAIEICAANRFRLPLWGRLRVCIGPGIPKWSATQETNRGIHTIRVILRDGSVEEIKTDPTAPITIDQES